MLRESCRRHHGRAVDQVRAWTGRVRAALHRVDRPTAMLIFGIAVALLVIYLLTVTPISRRH
jgi:hypothetical protein